MRHEVAQCLVSLTPSEGGGRATFTFPAHLSVFAGHFPGYPIVPGVYLVEAVRVAAERLQGRLFRIAGVENAKFAATIGPGATVSIDVTMARREEEWLCRGTVHCDGRRAAVVELRLCE